MSKKLIAVASAAALALSALVAMPTVANATGPFAVAITGQETTGQVNRTGATSTNPLQIFVPSNDVIRSVDTAVGAIPAGSSTALRLAITTPGATDAITVTATGGVEVITDTQFDLGTATTATGVQSLTDVAAAGSAVIYAYTTSTTAGTVVISAAGSSRTIHIQGLSDVKHNQYKLAFTAPATGAISGTVTVTGTVRDMFDNLLTPAAANLEIKALGGNLGGGAATVTDFTVNATTKVVTFKVLLPDTATSAAISVAAVTPATAVTAFTGRAVSVFTIVNAVDLATQVAALTAQVAALTADYNALAAKWNKRVANKKAPKKAVTLK
jgi:hypothetical protein